MQKNKYFNAHCVTPATLVALLFHSSFDFFFLLAVMCIAGVTECALIFFLYFVYVRYYMYIYIYM